MPFQKYIVATGELGEGRMNLPFPTDPATEAVVSVPTYLDPTLWKVVSGVVTAKTASETTTATSAIKDTQSTAGYDAALAIQALATLVVQQLNIVRAGLPSPLPPITLAAARTAFISNYRALL